MLQNFVLTRKTKRKSYLGKVNFRKQMIFLRFMILGKNYIGSNTVKKVC